MSEERASYIAADVTTVTPDMPIMPATRLERARERLWRRMMQAKREGARYVVVDLTTLTLAVAAKVEQFGRDENVLVDESHD